ncbi:MAG: IS4 family transposase [Myxacorys californica WJT36-NPBG1]|nr:IS4 family transposase [Myxacorys californica WJT36-NPBG1]
MLPQFYQACVQAQLSQAQFITLQMLVELLQRERCITLERLAMLFAQPIQFESRRRNLQRFLSLPPLQPKAMWFPIVKHWVKQQYGRGKQLCLAIDRTQWQDHNLLMVSLIHGKRAIPLYWRLLDKQGQSNLDEQKSVIAPVLRLLHGYRLVLLGDREFHSIALAAWCVRQRIGFVFRLPKSTTVKTAENSDFERLDALPQSPGTTQFHVQLQVTQKTGFGKHNLALRWKRQHRSDKANEVWYLLTNLETAEAALKRYALRFRIEGMFKDFKSGGYDMEHCHVNHERFLALLGLIAIAYTISTERGTRIRRQHVQQYVARVNSNRRIRQHSNFWIGLYGTLWIDAMDAWSVWAERLMRLKPQKRSFFLRGLRALSLIQSAF